MLKRSLPLALLVVLAALSLPLPAGAAGGSTVTTVPDWDGSSAVGTYGLNFATPTYGETVTGTGENLQSVTFYLRTNSEPVTARGGVGVWDGSKITSIVSLQGSFATIAAGSAAFVPVTFHPDVVLSSGQQYVVFLTALGDGGGGSAEWGILNSDTSYPGGSFVYTNNPDPATALTTDWDGIGWGVDLAFSLQFGAADVNRGGYCSVKGNTWPNGTPLDPGTFLDLGTEQPNTDANFTGATPAFYYEGVGISCDRLSGYHATGELVGYGGHGDAGNYIYNARN